MTRSATDVTSRRNVLRTAGIVGLASVLGVSGTAVANPDRKGNNYGDANGIGAFLNEKAEYKRSPVWSEGIVDETGRANVEVVVGAMTSVEIPDVPFDEAPVSFAPRAVTVSPGTDVTWSWASHPAPVPPIPHDVVSLEDGLFDSGIRPPGGSDFTHTFDDAGTYLYYCTPHGAPFVVPAHGGGTVYNEFGMRGAILVVDE